MPRGVYVRKKKFRVDRPQPVSLFPAVEKPAKNETDAEIEQKLADRFEILELMTRDCTTGDVRSLVVSGPAGLGKSYTVEETLIDWDPKAERHEIVKGYARAPGLYKLLYRHRNGTLVLDDADAVWFDDISIGFLKVVCDTTKKRVVNYLSEGVLVDDDTGEIIPKRFEFNGTIIFLTNYDFDDLIERGHRLAPHMQAMISRSHYIDLAMRTKRDYLVRIRMKVRDGMLRKQVGLDKAGEEDTMKFIEENADNLRELSLRMAIKIGHIRKRNRANWRKEVRITCCKER